MHASFRPARRAFLHGCAALALAAGALPLQAAERYSPPASAVLTYKLNASAKGFKINVDSTLEWLRTGSDYKLVNRGSFMFFSFVWESTGKVGAGGLQPVRYQETRNKRVKTAEFDAAGGRLRLPSGDEETLEPGTQDRMSVLLQLAAIGRADAGAFAAGKVLPFRVAGSSRSDNWRFRVVGKETLSTPMGNMEAVHLVRERDHDDGQKVEVWLAPGHDWLPVRVLSNEADGDFLDQVVAKIERPAS
ncbi:MAG: DUF3108 domain-containing protein [Pigmentiphaga sp.]|uniref:DUF3108 domain-containing protein n=1 Tax=Pigmentiphaga sp. TaxID=1977564 RepID=UPI0029BEDE14|nr:DUF3108 domain-containing protein [Pigmentiphaga sp.]MDX3907052.1 DUF3108 domain-containing protein [Pigmentiphaga sp.]